MLNEVVKSFLQEPDKEKPSSLVHPDNIMVDLSNDDSDQQTTGAFFDDFQNTVYGLSDLNNVIGTQASKIKNYREVAMNPAVDEALDIIINEIVLSTDNTAPVSLQVNLDNDKLSEKLNESFTKVLNIMNINRNIFNVVKRGYIDGQFIFHCAFDDKKTNAGIKSVNMIEPSWFYYDKLDGTYKYSDNKHSTHYAVENKLKYSKEEIVQGDFGLYDGNLKLSYLEYAAKSANMLRTLEDLLVPLRFSRSISRRVFNVDIGDLPTKRGEEVMQEHQRKFKYKKFYNNETGEVSNQQHITSMVEDYWFANRSGGKGTTAELLDETGNLGELGDILYFSKKLYKALKIPQSRLPDAENHDGDFEFGTTRTTKEDFQFFMFISRIRGIISELFKEILRREVISTKIMTAQEWEDNKDAISVVFTEENTFIEKMRLDTFIQKIDIFSQTQELHGKLFSVDTILKKVFKLSDSEIDEEFDKIKKEEKDPRFAKFYGDE